MNQRIWVGKLCPARKGQPMPYKIKNDNINYKILAIMDELKKILKDNTAFAEMNKGLGGKMNKEMLNLFVELQRGANPNKTKLEKYFRETCLKIDKSKKMPFVFLETQNTTVFLANTLIPIAQLSEQNLKGKSYEAAGKEINEFLKKKVKGFATGYAENVKDMEGKWYTESFHNKPTWVFSIRNTETKFQGKVTKKNLNLKIMNLEYVPQSKSDSDLPIIVKYGLKVDESVLKDYNKNYKILEKIFEGSQTMKELTAKLEANNGKLEDGVITARMFSNAFLGEGYSPKDMDNAKAAIIKCVGLYENEMGEKEQEEYEEKDDKVHSWRVVLKAIYKSRGKEKEAEDAENAQLLEELVELSETVRKEIDRLKQFRDLAKKADWENDMLMPVWEKYGVLADIPEHKREGFVKQYVLLEYQQLIKSAKHYNHEYKNLEKEMEALPGAENPTVFSKEIKDLKAFLMAKSALAAVMGGGDRTKTHKELELRLNKLEKDANQEKTNPTVNSILKLLGHYQIFRVSPKFKSILKGANKDAELSEQYERIGTMLDKMAKSAQMRDALLEFLKFDNNGEVLGKFKNDLDQAKNSLLEQLNTSDQLKFVADTAVHNFGTTIDGIIKDIEMKTRGLLQAVNVIAKDKDAQLKISKRMNIIRKKLKVMTNLAQEKVEEFKVKSSGLSSLEQQFDSIRDDLSKPLNAKAMEMSLLFEQIKEDVRNIQNDFDTFTTTVAESLSEN